MSKHEMKSYNTHKKFSYRSVSCKNLTTRYAAHPEEAKTEETDEKEEFEVQMPVAATTVLS